MNTLISILFTIYGIITLYFFFKFYKSKFSLENTIQEIKKDLSKIFPCCINKKNIEEKISYEKAEELAIEMEKLNQNSDCKEPFGVPLDICLDGTLSKEEILIREKVLKIINKKDFKVQNGGKDKLVLPMEAILFLTKNLNPLVSEHGEITIKMSSEFNNNNNNNNNDSIPTEELQKLIIELKDKESLLYKDDEELLNSINFLMKHKKFHNKEEIYNQENSINKEEIIVLKEETKPSTQEIIYKNNKEEIFTPEIVNGPDEDIYENKSQNKDSSFISINSSPYDNEDIDYNQLNNDMNAINSDLDINDLLLQELESVNFDDVVSTNEDKEEKNFYKELNFKTIKNCSLDFEHLEDSITNLFNKNESISILLNNIAKSQPLIFNPNKTVCLIDQNIILFGIAKMFGMESKTYLEQFQKLNKDILKKINIILEQKLELYLSDLLSGSKKPNFYLIRDNNGHDYFTFAFVFQTNAFKTCFNNEKFDYFRSFPYNSNYNFVKKASIEDTKNSPKLIIDIKDVEIK